MHAQRTHFPALLVSLTASTLLMGIALRGDTSPEPKHPQRNKPQQTAPAPVVPLVIPDFKGASDSQIVKLRDGLEEQQVYLQEVLLEQLQDEKLSPLGRVETIALLGQFPATGRSIVALIQNIDVVANSRPDENNRESGRFRGYIARHVLAWFGAPAEKQILAVIAAPQPTAAQLENAPGLRDVSFDPAKAKGYADVLTRIEGKEKALEILQEAQTKAEGPQIKAQFLAVMDAVKEGEKLRIQY
jgi:hypothetical protein